MNGHSSSPSFFLFLLRSEILSYSLTVGHSVSQCPGHPVPSPSQAPWRGRGRGRRPQGLSVGGCPQPWESPGSNTSRPVPPSRGTAVQLVT